MPVSTLGAVERNEGHHLHPSAVPVPRAERDTGQFQCGEAAGGLEKAEHEEGQVAVEQNGKQPEAGQAPGGNARERGEEGWGDGVGMKVPRVNPFKRLALS